MAAGAKASWTEIRDSFNRLEPPSVSSSFNPASPWAAESFLGEVSRTTPWDFLRPIHSHQLSRPFTSGTLTRSIFLFLYFTFLTVNCWGHRDRMEKKTLFHFFDIKIVGFQCLRTELYDVVEHLWFYDFHRNLRSSLKIYISLSLQKMRQTTIWGTLR